MHFSDASAKTERNPRLDCDQIAVHQLSGTLRTIVSLKSTTDQKRKRKAEKVVERIKPEKEE